MTMPLGNVTGAVETSAATASFVEMLATDAPTVANADALRKSRREEFEFFIFFSDLARSEYSDSARSRFNPAAFHGMDARLNRWRRQATTARWPAFCVQRQVAMNR
jgi:hypothetical protein